MKESEIDWDSSGDDGWIQATLDAMDGDSWGEDAKGRTVLRKGQISADAARARALKTRQRHEMRRAVSEQRLRDIIDWHLTPGDCWHIMSAGDIDLLSAVRFVVEAQPLEYLSISTWVLAMADAEEIAGWLAKGYVGRVDLYVGERTIEQYDSVRDIMERTLPSHGGRMCASRNHSKVCLMFGRDFDAVLESSANVNTNPRMEQMTLTVDSELAMWYKSIYDGVESQTPWAWEWEPWQRRETTESG